MSDSLNNEQREQLLTAYFDNELGPVERAQAESILAEDPEQTRLLQQWQENREAIQELPRVSLDAGFSGRVLAAIGASSDVSGELVESNGDQNRRQAELQPNPWRSGLSLIAVLAAMVLMTLFVFPRFNESEVAMHPIESMASDRDLSQNTPEDPGVQVSVDSIARQPVSGGRNNSLAGGNNHGRPVDPIRFPEFAGPRVEQVLWVENKSLAELESVLANHRIRVVDREGNSQVPVHFVPKSQVRVEAVYVISSADRMKRAIAEMTSQTCKVNSLPLPLGFGPDSSESAQIDYASAQQIEPMDLSGSSSTATEIASLDRWFGLVGQSVPNRPIQFLLLVNTPLAAAKEKSVD